MTGMRKKAAILTAVYIVFLVLGLWFNGQHGIRHDRGFWKLDASGWYRAADGDRIRFEPDAPGSTSGTFQLELGGTALSAVRTQTEDGHIQAVFSDGWTVDSDEDHGFSSYIVVTSSGGDITYHDATYTLTDMDAGEYRFAPVGETVREPFYGEDGSVIGESIMRFSTSGVMLDRQEVWYNRPEFNTPEQETVVLREGVQLSGSKMWTYLFVNEAGEYLTYPDHPTDIQIGQFSRRRADVLHLMETIATGGTERWGHPGQALLYTLLYALGAASLLWPNQAAFFGRRWQFKEEPELSEDGLHASYIGSFIVLLLAVLLLFLPMS